jgi:hypothetical protein
MLRKILRFAQDDTSHLEYSDIADFQRSFPVNRKEKETAESAHPDKDGYYRRKVVYKCALTVKI